jgi:hypothetical protein
VKVSAKLLRQRCGNGISVSIVYAQTMQVESCREKHGFIYSFPARLFTTLADKDERHLVSVTDDSWSAFIQSHVYSPPQTTSTAHCKTRVTKYANVGYGATWAICRCTVQSSPVQSSPVTPWFVLALDTGDAECGASRNRHTANHDTEQAPFRCQSCRISSHASFTLPNA